MAKSILVSFALATVLSACGAAGPRGTDLAIRAPIDAREVARYHQLINAGLDAYEAELEAATHREYPSRRAALDAARDLGSETRMIHHIRSSLVSEGLSVEHLCQFSADHPGYANAQRPNYRQRTEAWKTLVERIATAPVAERPDNGSELTASLDIERHDG